AHILRPPAVAIEVAIVDEDDLAPPSDARACDDVAVAVAHGDDLRAVVARHDRARVAAAKMLDIDVARPAEEAVRLIGIVLAHDDLVAEADDEARTDVEDDVRLGWAITLPTAVAPVAPVAPVAMLERLAVIAGAGLIVAPAFAVLLAPAHIFLA